jgi:EAL domain-containing protein (putative c-di-GMP-specific phosphodiesterase class I)
MLARDAPERGGGASTPLVELSGRPDWRAAVLVVALLVTAWTIVALAGGASSVVVHLVYVPIVVAAVAYGRRGAIVTALAAGILSGPFVPVDVEVGAAQAAATWLLRTGFFVLVGWLTAAALASVERRYRDELVRQLGRELQPIDRVDGDLPGDTDGDHGLDDILAAHRFHPVFQPVYSLEDGHLIAVEALTRFDVEPCSPPDVWFARAERAGLGDAFELAAIAAAIAASEPLPADITLTVNCSPHTLRTPELLALVAARAPRRLIIEVTEHAVVDDYAGLTAAVEELRHHDVGLAVDDAGAGFASLRHVVRLDPELIKLDLSLTQNLRGDPLREALADCLIAFARRTGSRLVAEGIEHPADLTTWVDLGADAVQGFLLGEPGPLPVDLINERVVRSLAE